MSSISHYSPDRAMISNGIMHSAPNHFSHVRPCTICFDTHAQPHELADVHTQTHTPVNTVAHSFETNQIRFLTKKTLEGFTAVCCYSVGCGRLRWIWVVLPKTRQGGWGRNEGGEDKQSDRKEVGRTMFVWPCAKQRKWENYIDSVRGQRWRQLELLCERQK